MKLTTGNKFQQRRLQLGWTYEYLEILLGESNVGNVRSKLRYINSCNIVTYAKFSKYLGFGEVKINEDSN